MKNLKKFLRSSKKLEARHTDRKAREVEEVYTFNLQQEYHKHREFDRLHELSSAHARHKEGVLLNTEDFEQQAQEDRQYGSDSEFERIAELQGFHFEPQPHRLKQLPAGSHDVFSHDLSEEAEIHLQKETAKNRRALKQDPSLKAGTGNPIPIPAHDLYGGDDEDFEDEDMSNNVFYFRPLKTKRK